MKTNLIFGSTALKHWIPELKRTPKDIDVIAMPNIVAGFYLTGLVKSIVQVTDKRVEYHYNPAFDYILNNNKHDVFVDLNFLYTIKCSHLHYDINWDKHCLDVMLMQSKGAELDHKLFDLLMIDWKEIHGKKRVNLNLSKDEFFTPYVTRIIDHDELHSMLAYYDKPVYTRILKDGKDVLTDLSKWNNLNHEDKLICILEEVYVTAFERWKTLNPKHSKMKAMKLYCTSLAKNDYFKYAAINMKELYEHESNSHFQNKIKEIQDAYIKRN